MAKRDLERVGGAVAVDMTPMIDCTFNLLIFFLCNINFRALEGKLPLFLPKDVGVNVGAIERQIEPIGISVARRAPADVRDPHWTWRWNDLHVRVQGREMGSPRELYETLTHLRRSGPEPRVELRPRSGTLYIDTVKVLDELLRSGCSDVRFCGVPLDG
ncbi:MAG: biopolymer transporter ExbD [Planctomycetes bacterium]|nr:biopolymer transporter ExbD [Planctomycetota bacterium]